MKTHSSLFFALVLLFSLISITGFAQKDTTQIRYVKFATTVNPNYTRIALQEIQVFSNGANIASDGTISVNSKTYDSNVNAIIDGNKTSGWFSDDYQTLTSDNGVGPNEKNPHFIIVDLGAKYSLESLKLDLTGGWVFDYTFDFLVSEDSTSWSLVDSKIKSHGVYTYTSIPIQQVRYIKYACYYSSDYGQVNVQEIQAYSNGVNVALNKNVYANSYEYGDALSNGKNAVDGDPDSRWSSNRNDHISANAPETAPINVTLDLGIIQTVDSIQLTYGSNTTFELSVSADGNVWLEINKRLNDLNQYSYVLNHTMSVASSLVSVTGNSAKCISVVNNNIRPAIISRGVCWSTSPHPTESDFKMVNGAGNGQFTSTLNGLANNTLYYVRAYATNVNETKYSKELSFLSGLTIQTNPVTNIKNTTATSGGYVTAANGIQITERGLCWSTNPSPTVTDSYLASPSDSAEFTTALTNLTGGTKYYVRAYATTNEGTFYGNECTFKYQNQQYQASSDGYFPNEIFTENGEYNGQKYFISANGVSLYFDGYSWTIADFVTSGDSGNPPLGGWWDGTVLSLITQTTATVTFDKNSLKESSINDGSFGESITITHDNTGGASFTGIDNEDFMETGKAMVRNLPAGLGVRIIRNSNLSLTLSVTGYATGHISSDSINNLKVILLPGAFTNGSKAITNGCTGVISLNFFVPVNIVVTGTKASSDYSITANNNVILDNNCIFNIDKPTVANRLIVNPGAKLRLSSAVTLNNIVLKSDDSNSFCACQSANITVNGTVIFEKTMNDTTRYFLSFPCNVNVTDISVSGGGSPDNDFYILDYDGASRASGGEAESWTHITGGTLQAYKGYAFELKAGGGIKTLSFKLNKSIVQNEAEIASPVSFYSGSIGNNHKGWNLIGQPYLSKFAGSNAGIHYLTTRNGNAYTGQTNTQACSLNPFEAFFVQVANSGSVPFYLAGRQNNNSLIRLDNPETIQLNMSNSSGSDFSTLLPDNESASAYEIGQDLEKWLSTSTTKPQIYTLLDGIKYAFNALPVSSVVNLPIGFYSKTGGASTLSASNINVSGLSKLILNDTQTGSNTDLTTESYHFNADPGTNNTRFSITIQRVATDTPNGSANHVPVACIVNSRLIVNKLTANSGIRLYDATGRMLLSRKNVKTDRYEIPLNQAGIYVIQIDTELVTKSYKLINP